MSIEPTIIPQYEFDRARKERVKQLSAELNDLGYHVIKKDWVRKFGAMRQINNIAWWQTLEELRPTLVQRTKESMGRDIGHGIVESGAIQFDEIVDVTDGRMYRAVVSVILRDPQYDKPEWLK